MLGNSTESFCRGTLLCFRGFLVKKNVRDKAGREYHDFLSKIFAHSAESFRRGTFLCFRDFLVSKNVRNTGGGGNHDFPLELFCLSTESFRGFFCNSESFRYRNCSCLRAEYHDFFSEIFLSHSTESFRKGTLLCFKKFRASKIVRDKRVGGFHDFPSKLFCLSTESFRGGTLLCFKRFRVSKNVRNKRVGGFRDFPLKLFCRSTESFRRATLLFQKVSGIENC